MRINIFAEDFMNLKYLGCGTAAKTLYRQLSGMPDMDVSWNSKGRDFDIVHYHTFGPVSLLSLRYSQGIKILTVHVTPRLNEGGLAFSKYITRYYPYSYRKFDHIITLVDGCRSEVREIAPDVPTTTIPNGVDRNYFKMDEGKRKSFREQYKISDSEKVVLAVGQQTPRKGIYDFIELAKLHPEIRWVWVGGFPAGPFSKDRLKIEWMKKKCANNVIFTGFVPDIAQAYSGSDVFFMPSYSEMFVLVILEALSCGLPVVARGIPEFKEIFGGAVQFFNNIEEAGERISDEVLLKHYSNGSRDFTEQYDIKKVANMHCDLYRKLIES
ncbi:MAG TPA: glycosyltransferase family 4 protein [Candidatus Methanoperedens sp.]|nr:glycosyltransferase family 4 protein [Candidatus Methanoperedens sp.]